MGKWFVLLLLLGCSEVYAHDARQKTDSLLNRIEHKVAGDLDYIENYKLYPTKNIYTFILLDKFNGNTWHVQWGTEESQRTVRWIRRAR